MLETEPVRKGGYISFKVDKNETPIKSTEREFVEVLLEAHSELQALDIDILPSEVINMGIGQYKTRSKESKEVARSKFTKMDCTMGLINRLPMIVEFNTQQTYALRDAVSKIFETNLHFPSLKITQLRSFGIQCGTKIEKPWENYGL